MINVAAIRAWEAKLREPGRRQGLRLLAERMEDGTVAQCCLDVACEVYLEAGGTDVKPRWNSNMVREYRGDGGTRESYVLPPEVRNWFGFDSCSPHLRGENGTGRKATEWNDVARASFPVIADAVRRTWPEVFADAG